MVSNVEIEMRWVGAWNDLSDIVADRLDAPASYPTGPSSPPLGVAAGFKTPSTQGIMSASKRVGLGTAAG